MAVETRLELKDLRKDYGGQTVVDGVSLAVLPGKVTCLLGPSGCGKSTTLRMIAGVERPDAGEIFIDGNLVHGAGRSLPPEHRSVGLMFQDFALFPHLSVAKNVAFGLYASKQDVGRRVESLLKKVGMLRHIDRYPHELSGGEQQRVALARALAPKPKVMLMDEPFSGLDERLRDEIREEPLDVLAAEGTAILLVTHEPHEAMHMADNIALMRQGRIVQRGAPYNIYNQPVDQAAAEFFSDINVIHGKVQGALTETPFGQFLAPGVADGTEVAICIRPQHLKIDFDRGGKGPAPTPAEGTAARGIVRRARYRGADSRVEFTMEHDGTVLQAQVPSVFLPKPGTPLWIMFRRDRCFVFPRDRASA